MSRRLLLDLLKTELDLAVLYGLLYSKYVREYPPWELDTSIVHTCMHGHALLSALT